MNILILHNYVKLIEHQNYNSLLYIILINQPIASTFLKIVEYLKNSFLFFWVMLRQSLTHALGDALHLQVSAFFLKRLLHQYF